MTSKEKTEIVLKLWALGQSGSQIAEQIDSTRCAVLGRLYRLRRKGLLGYRERVKAFNKAHLYGLTPEEKLARRLNLADKATRTKTRRYAAPAVSLSHAARGYRADLDGPILTDRSRPTITEARGCRFGIGVNAEYQHLFCDEARRERSSFCAHHHSLVFVKARPAVKAREMEHLLRGENPRIKVSAMTGVRI